jgi:GH25 family lysozyme M1 (1,4-beta-N-acetylmuramidase)
MKGIDLAKWNVVTDYKALKDAGVEFAIVKVINASNNPDGSFYTHMAGLKAAGINCNMGYTYSYATTTAKAVIAANAFVKYAQETGIDFMWLDLEDVCMTKLAHDIVNVIKEYKAAALANGLKFGVYTYSSFYDSYIKAYIKELGDVPFWIARYPSTKDMQITDNVPDTKNLPSGINISGWQYSSKGVISGAKGYIDLNAWYDNTTMSDNTIVVSNTTSETITTDINPFTEPESSCSVGTLGNDANWVLWYLWRFGKLTDENGNPDSSQINGVYSRDTEKKVKEVQSLLGFTGKMVDGIVGKKTRAVFKKIA